MHQDALIETNTRTTDDSNDGYADIAAVPVQTKNLAAFSLQALEKLPTQLGGINLFACRA